MCACEGPECSFAASLPDGGRDPTWRGCILVTRTEARPFSSRRLNEMRCAVMQCRWTRMTPSDPRASTWRCGCGPSSSPASERPRQPRRTSCAFARIGSLKFKTPTRRRYPRAFKPCESARCCDEPEQHQDGNGDLGITRVSHPIPDSVATGAEISTPPPFSFAQLYLDQVAGRTKEKKYTFDVAFNQQVRRDPHPPPPAPVLS